MPGSTRIRPVEDTVPKVDNEIAVGEDLEFQRKWWRFERIIWIFFTIVVVLDLLGAFGRGWLAHAHMQSPDGDIDVHYERIERTGTPSMMRVQFRQSAIQNGKLMLYVSESFVRELGARRIIPQPLSSAVGQGGITYTFPANVQPASVVFALQPAGPGVFPFVLRQPGKPAMQAKVFVVP
jgi:hypothetical protein